MTFSPTIILATRGSALALAQANQVLAQCRVYFPELRFDLKIIRTSGDKLQSASMARIDSSLPRGLFTKELEAALLEGHADLAVHSLKDLPTELPPGLKLGGVAGKRQDVRDVLIHRQPSPCSLKTLPQGLTVATSSTRRAAQLLALRPDFHITQIRGNVATRLEKLAHQPELDATILAAAGLIRLNFKFNGTGPLSGKGVPGGLLATVLEPEEMLPCVGQAAIGIEIRESDPRLEEICRRINDPDTLHCVTAERALLRAMGGGCQTPIGAYAQMRDGQIHLRAVSFMGQTVKRAEMAGPKEQALQLGEELAAQLK